MSPRRHTSAAYVGVLAACALLLSGCFGSGGGQTPSAHRSRPHQSQTSEPTGSPTSAATSTPTVSPALSLRFSPRSGSKHVNDCQKLQPGDDPAEFVYYPVLVTATSAVTLDSVATDHTTGVVDAGSWVAQAAATPETGTFKGWPPTFVAQDPNLQWKTRIPAQGAALAAATTYNVFLRLQVDPTPGDSTSRGLVFSYHDASGSHTATWKATTTFSMSC